jgi:hypothetical protein
LVDIGISLFDVYRNEFPGATPNIICAGGPSRFLAKKSEDIWFSFVLILL